MTLRNEYTLNVDLKRKYTAVVPTFVQNDSATLIFKIFDNGLYYDLSGFERAEVTTKRKDGKVVIGLASIEGDVGNKYVKYEYLGNEMAEDGFAETTLTLISPTTQVSIQPFKVHVIGDIRNAVGATEEYGVVKELIIETNDAIERNDEAINNAITATAELNVLIDETKFAELYSNTTQYKKNNIVTFNGSSFMAKKDTINNQPPLLPTTENEFWGLVSRRGDDGNNVVQIHKETFISTQGQSVFNVSRQYEVGKNKLRVFVGGVPQFAPSNFSETSNTRFTLSESIPAGYEVIAEIIYNT